MASWVVDGDSCSYIIKKLLGNSLSAFEIIGKFFSWPRHPLLFIRLLLHITEEQTGTLYLQGRNRFMALEQLNDLPPDDQIDRKCFQIQGVVPIFWYRTNPLVQRVKPEPDAKPVQLGLLVSKNDAVQRLHRRVYLWGSGIVN
jgi:hypothetical protein